MSAIIVQPPFELFTDIDGQPLEAGFVWIGTANLDPQTNPIQVYWDQDLTIPAAQPLRTIGGYVVNSGTPSRIFVDGVAYSIRVMNKNGSTIYSEASVTGLDPNASGVAFTGFKGQVGFVSDLADDDGSDWIGFEPAGSGAVAQSVQDKLRESVSVKDFGAVGDGVTDDGAAIQAALDYCSTSGQTLYFPAAAYNSSQAHTATGSFSLLMDGAMVYTGSSAITFLTLDNNRNGTHRIKLTAATVNWSNDDFIGLYATNVVQSTFDLYISNFARGARLGGDNNFAYNIVYPSAMRQNRIGLDLNNKGSVGFVNQNTFIGGRFGIFTASALDSFSRVGVRITSETNNYYNNNNVFINQNFELRSFAVTGGATAIPILMEYGQRNSFIDCRNENGATGGAVVEEYDSALNRYSFLFSDASSSFIDYRGTYRSSLLTTARSIETKFALPYLMVDSGPIYERANLYNGSTNTSVDGTHWQTSTAATPSIAATSVVINTDNLSFASSRAIGVFARIGSARKFFVSTKVKSGQMRFIIACFDSAGNRLTNTSPNHPYVVGSLAQGVNYVSDFGGAYRSGSDRAAQYFAITNNDVHTIQILISGGSSGVELQEFKIWADEDIDVFSGVPNLNSRRKLGTAEPTAGTWVQGDMVWNSAPTAGGTLGWICVAGGSPGTWKTFGSIQA
jgi:hypothetical protein